ncbi:hypothetical protein RHSIM_Rhsim01G0287400 [Rhododendron simsii]|uniref:Uncharacterized protein n=1 Tax=Rhododendron simsii TaxID=118357 RepID=A0A834HJ58_RHOSS|nr:hypothetical protein RHSIM_Rhsim01G0287400 [Rhododendron simsii]
MEKPKDTIKQEKQKIAISIGGGSGGGGGGVGGVLVWGGVAAIATLVSVISAIKLRNKRLPNKTNHHPPQPQPIPTTTDACNQLEVNNDNSSNEDLGKGLLVLLEDNSSPPPDYHPSGDGIKDASPTQIDSTPLDTSKSLILDIDTMLEITRPKEKPNYLDIVLGDDPKPKNSSLETDYYGVNKQDYSLVAEEKAIEDELLQSDQFEGGLPKIQSMGQGGGEEEEQENGAELVNEVTETFQIDPFAVQFNREVFKVMTEDEAVRAPDAPQFGAEDDIKKMQLIGKGEQEEEQDDGDNIADMVERVIETTQKDQFAVEFNLEEIQVMKEQENGENIVEVVKEVVKTAQKDRFTKEINREAIQVMEEEKTIDSPRIEAEDNPEIQLIEEKKGHDHGENDEAVGTIQDNQLLRFSEEEDSDENDEYADEEEMAEKGEESSEETGDSSMESNAEAIWPLESIEGLSQQLKEESKTNIQKPEEKIDEYSTGKTEESGCHASINNEGIYANGNYKIEDTVQSRISPMKELLMRINVSTDTSNMGIWISSAAVLLLLVVGPLLLSFANIVKLCLIVFLLVMILSHIWELP